MKYIKRSLIIFLLIIMSFLYFNTVTVSNAAGTVSDTMSGANSFVKKR